MDNLLDKQTSFYNGVSNRSHERKARKPLVVVKWDGASKSSEVWDSLRKDPDLWLRDGDCYVHLHDRGQSRRGPAFKVPYSALLEAKFQPLIDKFMPRARFKPTQMNAYDCSEARSHHESPTGARIELFIPAPVELDKRHSYNYHLATRNLFAFIFRRSMVGECLGSTLITLMHSLQQFRTPDANNIQDLISYMDEEGYLDLNGQPTYASAMLLLGEAFQLRDLYIDAFAHCCGMSDRLYLASEYQFIPSTTRELIQRTRFEMYSRLRKASTMLKTLCAETDTALYPGAQEHLHVFRHFLQGVYAIRFGCYPPQVAIFDVDVFCTMRHDFKALYEFLRDESPEISGTTRFSIENGTSTLLMLKSFDLRYNHKTLAHPLPLLPDNPRKKSTSWWSQPIKTSRSRRAHDLAALSRATNLHRLDVMGNHLVSAYRRFEEGHILFPIKAGKRNNLGPVDGRKIRWNLIYAIYQTLCQATEVAEEIRDVRGVPYHLCISTVGLPPWEIRRPVDPLAQHQLDQGSLLTLSPPSVPCLDVKLGNDDCATANQATWDAEKGLGNTVFKGSFVGTITRKSSALWRSLNLLAKHESEGSRPMAQRASHHGIVGRGHSKMVNTEDGEEKLAAEMPSANPANLAHPLKENPIGGVPDSPGQHTSDTSDTYVTLSPPKSPIEKWEDERASLCTRCGLHDVNYGMSSSRWSKPLRVDDYGYHPKRRTIQFHDESPPIPLRRRPMSVYDDPRKRLQLAPLDVYKAKENSAVDLKIQMPSPQTPTAWNHIQGVMEVQARNYESRVEAEWSQFTHLGRLIQARSDTPTPAITSTSRRASAMF
ncbi:hypothetical protein F4782DRAFT_407228 [Xylaria castorea]|nr:hypothetical protein F4782DRAFT_407228 [Xylaria castorea]